jgi:hypothetical protein
MGRILSVRTLALVLAVAAASFISMPSFSRSGLFSLVSPISVDRSLKGDRLPLTAHVDKAGTTLSTAQSRAAIPVGCDRAFSPISAPRLANVFGRCSV